MSIAKGSLVVNEMIIPIVDIYVADGEFQIVGELCGPVSAGSAGRYVVCDRGGAVVYRSRRRLITWPAVRAGETFVFTAHLEIENRQASEDGDSGVALR